ncbi:MAG TPA: hypothetical protein VEK05_03845, partial [Burkholderiales bacterium]|nr:hypothetical protein [Burkholderiales bacterium]
MSESRLERGLTVGTGSGRARARGLIFSVAALLLVAGCAPVVVKAPTAATPMKGKEGSVVVSVTGNTARVSQFDSITIKQYIKPEPGVAPITAEYILNQVSEGLARD